MPQKILCPRRGIRCSSVQARMASTVCNSPCRGGFHVVPFQGVLGDGRVEVGEKEAEILLPILRAHAAIERLAGQGGAKPKLMPLLFDRHFRARRRLDDQQALAVLLDGCVRVPCRLWATVTPTALKKTMPK